MARRTRPWLLALLLLARCAAYTRPAVQPEARWQQRRRVQTALMAAAGFDVDMFRKYANPATFEGSARTIVEFPSPILRAANAEVTAFDDEFAALCAEFFTIMYAANGVGIAAPQVGLNLRLFVYNTDPTAPGMLRKMGERVVANPRIVEYCQGTDVDIEGCLSSRSECCIGDIRRAKQLVVEYQDVRGQLQKKTLKNFEARVFQHEFDHLEGVLHIDRQCAADRRRIQPFLDVLAEQHGPGGALEPDPQKLANLQPPPLEKRAAAADADGPPTRRTPPPPKPRPATTRAAAEGAAAKPGGFGSGGGARPAGGKAKGKSKATKRRK